MGLDDLEGMVFQIVGTLGTIAAAAYFGPDLLKDQPSPQQAALQAFQQPQGTQTATVNPVTPQPSTSQRQTIPQNPRRQRLPQQGPVQPAPVKIDPNLVAQYSPANINVHFENAITGAYAALGNARSRANEHDRQKVISGFRAIGSATKLGFEADEYNRRRSRSRFSSSSSIERTVDDLGEDVAGFLNEGAAAKAERIGLVNYEALITEAEAAKTEFDDVYSHLAPTLNDPSSVKELMASAPYNSARSKLATAVAKLGTMDGRSRYRGGFRSSSRSRGLISR